MFLIRLFKNPDKKPKKKKDLIKWFARRHYLFTFILTCVLDVILLVCIGFNFKKIFVSIPFIALCVPFGIITFISVTYLLRNISIAALVKKHDNDILTQRSRVDFRKGPPGSGKSTQTIYEAVVLAKHCEEELTYKYWLYLGQSEKRLSDFDKKEKEEVMQAYKYYQEQNTIPCLWSNVPIEDDAGRKANKLTSKHLLQQEKLPYLSVMFSDEIGSEFEAKRGGNTKDLKPLSLMGRFIRHFLDGYWRLTEQDEKKSFIDIRRVVERVVMCISQKWVLKPIILDKIYNFIKHHYVKKTQKLAKFKLNSKTFNKLNKRLYHTSKIHSSSLIKFKHYLNCVGYRKYFVEEREYNEEGSAILSAKTSSFYTPSCLNVKYNDRCFYAMYKAKDKEIKVSKFKSNVLTEEDISEMYESKD